MNKLFYTLLKINNHMRILFLQSYFSIKIYFISMLFFLTGLNQSDIIIFINKTNFIRNNAGLTAIY